MDAELEPSVTIKTRFGKTRLMLQVSILALVAFLVLHVTLLSDRHNDGRYVRLEDYQKDRASDEKLQGEVSRGIGRRMDDQDRKLSEIAQDIKELLRGARRTP